MRNLETANHLFVKCLVSRQVWTEISNWVDVPSLHPYRWHANQAVAGWFNELSGSTASSQSRGIQSMAILICWSLWRERNARVFEGVEKNCSRIVADIKEEVWMWCHAGAKHISVIVSSLVREYSHNFYTDLAFLRGQCCCMKQSLLLKLHMPVNCWSFQKKIEGIE
jgi:hypothetical protein